MFAANFPFVTVMVISEVTLSIHIRVYSTLLTLARIPSFVNPGASVPLERPGCSHFPTSEARIR